MLSIITTRNGVIFFFHSNYREIDLNGLVGYIGAYIGLILGYSILQIPDLILLVSRNAKKYLVSRNASGTNNLSRPLTICVKEQLSNTNGLETTTRNTIYGCQRSAWIPQSDLEQIISQKMSDFSQQIRGELDVLKVKIEILEERYLCK